MPVHAAQQAASTVEEPFLDAGSGYRACFATGSPACADGWRLSDTNDAKRLFNAERAVPHLYLPSTRMQAFGGEVEAILFSRSEAMGSGYQLFVNALPDKVAAALTARLANRKIHAIRVDRHPEGFGGDGYQALLQREFKWEAPDDSELFRAIRTQKKLGDGDRYVDCADGGLCERTRLECGGDVGTV